MRLLKEFLLSLSVGMLIGLTIMVPYRIGQEHPRTDPDHRTLVEVLDYGTCGVATPLPFPEGYALVQHGEVFILSPDQLGAYVRACSQ